MSANGPTWSSDEPNAISPCRDTAPYVGFSPTMPHRAAGWRIDPPVSVPSESGANPAATAAADPPLEPPGTREGSHGLWVTPKAECSVDEPIANSSMLVLPIGTSPAAFARVTQPASYSGRCPCRIREPAVVSSPRVQRMSLSAIGTPCSPVRPSASSRSASASASAERTRRNACTPPSSRSIRSR